MTRRTALYRHYDADCALLYIGITMRPGARLSEHLSGSHWAEQITHVSIDWFDDFAAAFSAERQAILAEKPMHNKSGVIRSDCASPGTAEKVRSLRIASNCNQTDFAEMIGATRTQLGQWETGNQRLSLTGALALREAFGVSLDWLYPRAGDALTDIQGRAAS